MLAGHVGQEDKTRYGLNLIKYSSSSKNPQYKRTVDLVYDIFDAVVDSVDMFHQDVFVKVFVIVFISLFLPQCICNCVDCAQRDMCSALMSVDPHFSTTSSIDFDMTLYVRIFFVFLMFHVLIVFLMII